MKESIEPKLRMPVGPRDLRSQIQHLPQNRKIAFYRFGKIKLFKISELESALEAYRVATTSEVLS